MGRRCTLQEMRDHTQVVMVDLVVMGLQVGTMVEITRDKIQVGLVDTAHNLVVMVDTTHPVEMIMVEIMVVKAQRDPEAIREAQIKIIGKMEVLHNMMTVEITKENVIQKKRNVEMREEMVAVTMPEMVGEIMLEMVEEMV